MRKLFTFLFAALMSVGMWAIPAPTCGDGLTWEYNSTTNALTIYYDGSGTGAMDDYDYYGNPAPWFSSKESITSVIISNGLTRIGEAAFNQCTGLTSITIPNSVTSIGDDAFGSCSSLTSIEIPNSVEYIGGDAFYGCSNITDVYCYPNAANLTWNEVDCDDFKSGKATICHVNSDQLDAYQTKFNNVVRVTFAGDLDAPAPAVPANSCGDGVIWELNDGALTISYTGTGTGVMDNYDGEMTYAPWVSYYESITSVIISNGVTSIGDLAFYMCISLESVTIPNSVTSIGAGAFYLCSGLTSITIPNSVESIGMYAFAGCSDLTSVTIPNSVTSIGESAFQIVPNIVYSGSATGSPWDARSVNGYVDGFLVYSDNTKTNLLACSSQATGTIEIPNGVTSIGDYAFYYCPGITSITIPNSVISIGDDAFSGCSNLESVTINAESLESYGSYAFDGTAEGLKIYVPAGSVDTYKTAWADYADQIEAIPGGDEPATQEITPNVDPQNASVYYSTFYDSANKYALPAGVEAYVATISENALRLTRIAVAGQVIPNDNAVIFKSTVTPFTLTPSDADAVTFTATNDLQGSDTQIATPANCYVLAGTDGVVGFYHYTASQLNAHKAYVEFSGSNNAPRRMPFIFDAATGVENVQGNVQSTKMMENGVLYIIKNGVKYNAQGQIVK